MKDRHKLRSGVHRDSGDLFGDNYLAPVAEGDFEDNSQLEGKNWIFSRIKTLVLN
jgi:hypothetical protein